MDRAGRQALAKASANQEHPNTSVKTGSAAADAQLLIITHTLRLPGAAKQRRAFDFSPSCREVELKTKDMKQSKLELLKECARLGIEVGMLHCVLNDVLNKEVTWFYKGHQRLGICRPCGPEGGLVIHKTTIDKGYASAYLWEPWFNSIRHHSSPDKDATDLRNCAFKAHNWIINEQAK